MGMSITGPKQLQIAIDKAISGDRGIYLALENTLLTTIICVFT